MSRLFYIFAALILLAANSTTAEEETSNHTSFSSLDVESLVNTSHNILAELANLTMTAMGNETAMEDAATTIHNQQEQNITEPILATLNVSMASSSDDDESMAATTTPLAMSSLNDTDLVHTNLNASLIDLANATLAATPVVASSAASSHVSSWSSLLVASTALSLLWA